MHVYVYIYIVYMYMYMYMYAAFAICNGPRSEARRNAAASTGPKPLIAHDIAKGTALAHDSQCSEFVGTQQQRTDELRGTVLVARRDLA